MSRRDDGLEVRVTGKNGGGIATYCRKTMRSLYDAGCADREIARQLGCTHSTVGRWREGVGLPAISWRADGDPSPAAILVIERGLTFSQAARRLGVSRSAVAGAVFRARKKRQGSVGMQHAIR